MKLPNKRVLILLGSLTVVVLLGIGLGLGQSPANGTLQVRALELKELFGSIEGVAGEPARIFKTPDGYLRFVMALPSTHFAVDPNKRGTPQEAADAFLERWRNLFVRESPAVGFDPIRVKSIDFRSYVRYQQMYSGLDVFGAEIIVQLNAAGGVVAVMSDIMRDTETLDLGEVSLDPSIEPLTAQEQAIEWLGGQHEQLEFEATAATLMMYAPSVVGASGPTQLVWQTEVGNVGEPVVREFVLVNAHDGEIAFHYSLIYDAKYRKIYVSGELVREEGQGPYGNADVDNAYDYLGATYDFYYDEHGRDSLDDNGMTLIADVRIFFWCNAGWTGAKMRFGEGLAWDDMVGHEYTHGVTHGASNLIYRNESGAINESFSDMWGEWVDQGYTNGNDTDTPEVKWLMGEDVVCTGGAFRDMADPPQFGWRPDGGRWYVDPDRYEHPDFYRGNDDNGGVHHNSGVGNKLAYLLTDGDTFNGYTISGMEISKTADLFYECQTNLLTKSADYYDLGNMLMLAAFNIGLTEAERDNVEKACWAVEIYTATSGFYIKDSSGMPVAWVDDVGNLVLKGFLEKHSDCTATANDEFIFQDSFDNDVAIIDTTNGNMYIAGLLYDEGDGWVAPSGDNDFIIKDSSGDAVAYISDSGDLFLKGRLYSAGVLVAQGNPNTYTFGDNCGRCVGEGEGRWPDGETPKYVRIRFENVEANFGVSPVPEKVDIIYEQVGAGGWWSCLWELYGEYPFTGRWNLYTPGTTEVYLKRGTEQLFYFYDDADGCRTYFNVNDNDDGHGHGGTAEVKWGSGIDQAAYENQ